MSFLSSDGDSPVSDFSALPVCQTCGRDPIHCEVALAIHAGISWDVYAERDCWKAAFDGMSDARDAVHALALEALHELAWAAVLAGQSDAQSGLVLQPPLPGDLFRRKLAARAIALIEVLQ